MRACQKEARSCRPSGSTLIRPRFARPPSPARAGRRTRVTVYPAPAPPGPAPARGRRRRSPGRWAPAPRASPCRAGSGRARCPSLAPACVSCDGPSTSTTSLASTQAKSTVKTPTGTCRRNLAPSCRSRRLRQRISSATVCSRRRVRARSRRCSVVLGAMALHPAIAYRLFRFNRTGKLSTRAPSPACGRRWPCAAGSDEGASGQRPRPCRPRLHRPHPTRLRRATFSRREREKDARRRWTIIRNSRRSRRALLLPLAGEGGPFVRKGRMRACQKEAPTVPPCPAPPSSDPTAAGHPGSSPGQALLTSGTGEGRAASLDRLPDGLALSPCAPSPARREKVALSSERVG